MQQRDLGGGWTQNIPQGRRENNVFALKEQCLIYLNTLLVKNISKDRDSKIAA